MSLVIAAMSSESLLGPATPRIFFFWWAVGAGFFAVLFGAFALSEGPDKEGRLLARIAITCWAWPLWIVVGVAYCTYQVISIALSEGERRK